MLPPPLTFLSGSKPLFIYDSIQSVICLFLLLKAVQHGIGEAGADLGCYKAGCPMHLKGAPEVERRADGVCALLPEKFCISYIKMVSFHACFENMFFSKRAP